MCDYSLMAIPNRLAVSGEELVVHRFEAGAVGLASAFDLLRRQDCRKAQSHGFWSTLKNLLNPSGGQSIPAICIPPSARLLVQDIPAKLQRECRSSLASFRVSGRNRFPLPRLDHRRTVLLNVLSCAYPSALSIGLTEPR